MNGSMFTSGWFSVASVSCWTKLFFRSIGPWACPVTDPAALQRKSCPRRFDDAERMLQRAVQEHPAWAPGYRFLAACYARMGRLEEARRIVARLRELTPTVVPTATHWRDPVQREFYLGGLRMAVDGAM